MITYFFPECIQLAHEEEVITMFSGLFVLCLAFQACPAILAGNNNPFQKKHMISTLNSIHKYPNGGRCKHYPVRTLCLRGQARTQ